MWPYMSVCVLRACMWVHMCMHMCVYVCTGALSAVSLLLSLLHHQQRGWAALKGKWRTFDMNTILSHRGCKKRRHGPKVCTLVWSKHCACISASWSQVYQWRYSFRKSNLLSYPIHGVTSCNLTMRACMCTCVCTGAVSVLWVYSFPSYITNRCCGETELHWRESGWPSAQTGHTKCSYQTTSNWTRFSLTEMAST